MSLYYDATAILQSSGQKGSLKSIVYAKNSNIKSKPAHVYALLSETAKYDTFLKEVIENAGLLSQENKLTPLLSLLLVHDHFFSKNGIATAANHPLRQCIERHKARLQSEFTRARLKRKAGSVDQLKAKLLAERDNVTRKSPRWVRVNTLKISTQQLLKTHFGEYKQVSTVEQIMQTVGGQRILHKDRNIPDLIALAPDEDLTTSATYNAGEIIFQDKASCFPAHLLLGNCPPGSVKDVIDGCAAPGNKTTHAAAIISGTNLESRIYACERDTVRSETLQKMTNKAGASNSVSVLAKQDFLALGPEDDRFKDVTHVLLDPSCSGSGILGRTDIPRLALPTDPRAEKSKQQTKEPSNSKKRKRDVAGAELETEPSDDKDNAFNEAQPLAMDENRLEKLSNLQTQIVEHAMKFPSATKITYSTCSIHVEENESVVDRVLRSEIARTQGWRILARHEQVEGLNIWGHRGVKSLVEDGSICGHNLSEEEREACIRCNPYDAEGTMGFFVCGFIRDVASAEHNTSNGTLKIDGAETDEEWEGFSDT